MEVFPYFREQCMIINAPDESPSRYGVSADIKKLSRQTSLNKKFGNLLE
jgi:hypothetical protein